MIKIFGFKKHNFHGDGILKPGGVVTPAYKWWFLYCAKLINY